MCPFQNTKWFFFSNLFNNVEKKYSKLYQSQYFLFIHYIHQLAHLTKYRACHGTCTFWPHDCRSLVNEICKKTRNTTGPMPGAFNDNCKTFSWKDGKTISPAIQNHFRYVSKHIWKLDDGWPESVEEQGLLLLVWRHHSTNQYLKDVL